VRRRRNTWPSAVDGEISGFDVVDGSMRTYIGSMAGEPGRRLSEAATMTRCWSPSSAGMGMVGDRAVGAARDRRMLGSGVVIGVGAALRNVH
jgi:hypothetical protein